MRKRHLAALTVAAAVAVGPILTSPAFAAAPPATGPAATAAGKPVGHRPTTPAGRPTATPAVRPTVRPTTTPVVRPTVRPTATPTGTPTPKPARPTGRPSGKPTPVIATFSAAGRLTAVDAVAATVTVLVKGGRAGRGTSVTVPVAATALIRLDDAVSTLAALPVGGHVSVKGTVAGGVRTVTRINAESAEAPEPTPAPSA